MLKLFESSKSDNIFEDKSVKIGQSIDFPKDSARKLSENATSRPVVTSIGESKQGDKILLNEGWPENLKKNSQNTDGQKS